jgi:6-phosphogluconolactonase
MKLSKLGRLTLASIASLGMGLVTACGPSNTIDYLYVTASKQNPGQISVYKIDSQAGRLYQITDSPYGSGGRNPVAEVASNSGKNLYVVNHDDNTMVEFAIGTDGKLYPQQTCNMPGSFPTQMAINKDDTYLYIVETYQPNYSINVPGPGALVIFPLNDVGQVPSVGGNCQTISNGTNGFYPLGANPVSVNITANQSFVYAVNEGNASVSGSEPSVTGFSVNTDGTLNSIGTYQAGTKPNAITSTPNGSFLYVTDGGSNQLYGFQIQANGALVAMPSAFPTDNLPDAVAVDPTGRYAYVANYNANNVSAYTIDQTTGEASPVSGTPVYGVGSGPTCLLVEPNQGRYLYTSNFLSSTVSGLTLNTDNGTLTATQLSPFSSASQPTCTAVITHNFHGTSSTSSSQ